MNKMQWFKLAALALALSSAEATKTVFEDTSPLAPANEIDRLVFDKLSKLDIQPVLCSDAVFVRRAYLDIIGKVPTAEQAKSFIDDPDINNKRSNLIDELMARKEFADYWAMKWSDTLRIKAEFPINLWPNAAQAYHHWVHTSIADNKPYDQFVREMLTASGSNFRVGEVNFYRALQNKTPEGIAAAAALTFMGTRIDTWEEEQQQNLSLLFSQVGYKPTSEWKEEVVFWDPLQTTKVNGNAAPGNKKVTTVIAPNTNQPPATVERPDFATLPDGTRAKLTGNRDPRELYADWLITPENPWFARCAVNRAWAWLLGRGIIHEADDIRDDNPASNPELLNWLTKEFIAHNYDMNHLYRLILNSKTYQLSSVSNTGHPEAAAQFAAYPLRRLEAEVLIDAINDITGTTDLYTSAIPEPFTYIPKGQSAVSIADGSITSSFLALFGRSARATGMANERNNQITPPQWRHLLNSGHIQEKIERGPNLRKLLSNRKNPEERINLLYLAILSRYPTDAEIEAVMSYGNIGTPRQPQNQKKNKTKLTKEQKRQQAAKAKAISQAQINDWIDITWSLFNNSEFIYRH
jgi:hypothetical protein